MKMRFMVPVFGVLALASLAGAQAAPGKIGVMDFQGAIAGTAEGKAALAQLQSQFAPRQNEMAKLQKDIEDLNAKLKAGANTLSDAEKAKLQQQIDADTRTGQREMQDYQDDANTAQQEVLQTIGPKIVAVVQKYAQDNGFSMIFDGGSQQSTVVWATPTANITDAIVTLYDSTYPMKAGSGGAGASAPKPSSSTPSAPKPSGSTAPKPQQ